MSSDPLLQPYQLKHLTLRNRIMTTSHEPAYPEDGMPKGRYRLYHLERAKAGVALTMTAGSAAVSKDSPPVFNNILAYKDEVVPWMRRLADDCHEAGAAVMIQLTHLGRRTRWDKGDWLPVVIVLAFLAYALFGPYLPQPWTHKGYDIARLTTDMYLSDLTPAMKPSDAYAHIALRKTERVEIDHLEGRITVGLVTPYPPGIPLLIPGEVFNKKIVDYLKFAREFNLQCPGFETDIHGLVEVVGDDGVKRYYADCVKA